MLFQRPVLSFRCPSDHQTRRGWRRGRIHIVGARLATCHRACHRGMLSSSCFFFSLLCVYMSCNNIVITMGKLWIFGKNFPQGTNPPDRFFLQNWRRGGCLGSVHSRQISPFSLLKCGLTAAKIAKMCNFWYKFAQKGYTPLSDFYKIWLEGGSPRSTPSCQISPLWL